MFVQLLKSYVHSLLLKNQSKTDLEQMIGNAVPVKLAEYIANSVVEYIQSDSIRKEDKQLALQS
jgi:DNA (cytosine-5)-methyltransferase 1